MSISSLQNISNLKQNTISNSSPSYKYFNNIDEINVQNEDGETPIFSSILSNNILLLKNLLILGANPNIPNNLGQTPLHLCVNNNKYNEFLLLLKYNADCNFQNNRGDTPLHTAVKTKEKKFIKALLYNNANPNIQNLLYGKTPTHLVIINKFDEEILKLFKEYKADIFSIRDKFKKTPFDYAKDINDEKYISLINKIFGYDNHTNMNINKKLNFENNNYLYLNNTEKNKYCFNLDKFNELKDFSIGNNYNTDFYVITSETNRNEFKLENYNLNKDFQISNQSLTKNKIISSEVSSDNMQIKELNNSYEDNSNKSKNSLKEFLPDEINNNKENIDINNIKLNKCKNIYNQIYSIKSEVDNDSKNNGSKISSRNSKNSKSKNSSIVISHSNSSNNYSHKSNNCGENSSCNSNNINIYLTNSVGANKKIIKNIIRETVKRINIKSISSSDDNTSKSNIILFSKESEQNSHTNSNMEDTKSKRSKRSQFSNKNLDPNKINENKENQKYSNSDIFNNISNSSNTNNIKDNENDTNNNVVNLYENGTNSFVFLKTKKINDIVNNDNINLSKLIKNETTQTINISQIYEELYSNSNKTNDNNTLHIIDENSSNNHKDIIPIKNKNNIIINTNANSNFKINEIKGDIILETKNSHALDELQIRADKIGTINNDIFLNYSKNIPTEEDMQIHYKKIQNKKRDENNNKPNFIEDKNISDNTIQINSLSTINNNIDDSNNINDADSDNHIKKKSNGNLYSNIGFTKHKSFIENNNKNINIIKNIKNYKIRTHNNSTLDNFIDINEDYNGNNSLLKRKMIKNIINKNKNKSSHHKQLSYHLNCKTNLNHDDINKDNDIENNMNINNKIEIINTNINKNNCKDNNICYTTLKNENAYKNNIMNVWYSNTTNKNIKSSIKSKDSNNYSGIKRISKMSLNKSGSCQNMNPPPIEAAINKDLFVSPTSNQSINSINNQNYNLQNNIGNKKNKLSNANTLLNFTTLSTNKPKHSSLKRTSNNYINNLKNIPINHNYKYNNINPYINSNNFKEGFETDESNTSNMNNKINELKNISTRKLIRLREFLISCDLLCYYNLLLSNNMYNIDSYINDIKQGIPSITFDDIERIGIKKPGHIFRILIRLELDAGIIDNNLFNYITEKINFNSVTSTVALTSSINEIFCCGINLCENNINHNKIKIRNNAIYFNDLSSFLRAHDIVRFKGNFMHNGFDRIEYIIIQLFTKYAFDKNILNEYLHVYIDGDKNKLLNILYMVKFNIAREFGIEINKIVYSYDNYNNKESHNFMQGYDSNINSTNNISENKSNHICQIF